MATLYRNGCAQQVRVVQTSFDDCPTGESLVLLRNDYGHAQWWRTSPRGFGNIICSTEAQTGVERGWLRR